MSGPVTMELKNYGDKAVAEPVTSTATFEVGSTAPIDAGSGHLQRKLNAKQVQLYGIGTAIGTSVFVAMGSYLPTGGPAGLLMAFCIWSCVAFCINETYAEMVCYAPVPAPFVRFCSDWVDQALGFAVSWSFLLTSLFLIPFEITAFHKLIGFWGEFSVPATVFIVMAMYGVLNCVSVRWFGIAEFYLAIGKVVLIFFLFAFVIVTMCGGNPLGDAYGFRYWSDPGAFAEYLVEGVSGRFLGFLSCLTYATFTVCGFEYVSLVAAETKTPRRILPAAYKSYPFRLLFFFCGAALAMGICIPYNDETLNAIMSGKQAGSGTGAASPYVIAMERLKISGLPHFVNAIIMTSVFSAGNGYVFAASRTLYTMAEQGRAPKLFTRTIRSGIPIYAVCACLSFSLLALLNVSDNTTDVMGYFVSLVTTNQLLNYTSTCVTYIHFYHALKKQGISRNDLPYKGRLQPYGAYIGMVATTVMILLLGFYVFFPGQWSVKWFFLNYTFVAVFPIAFIAWKVVNKTTYQRLGTADLTLGGDVLEIDDYEKHADMEPLKGFSGWMERIFGGVRERKEIVD
ncbi:hypothetical protein BTJ68_01098 [Hortaea werneckii EXF-2000]|uniref:Amino acid permease/ SLC12A domain-containing protein n=2 Tax=Hortaea werneckii TaxID=91943 RepID=A0A3M7J2W0_HORWE|nr:hypothetical protein BTJ68_01098 [Hortaea werneckii EXF-2000]RMZ32138.1 hypothetical protein D0859_03729 [Hortaea werneckii]